MAEVIAQANHADLPMILNQLEQLKNTAWLRLLHHTLKTASNYAPEGGHLLTMKQAADQVALPVSRLYELARQGRLPVIRIGKYVRVQANALQAWLARHRAPI